jgi:hypothetical protein
VKKIARTLLKAVTCFAPVFIAACYGAPAEYGQSGRVVDSETRQGINGIKVSCLRGGADTGHWTNSYSDGYFYLWAEDECDLLRFEDVDGAANGGTYVSRTASVPVDGRDIEVDMAREP